MDAQERGLSVKKLVVWFKSVMLAHSELDFQMLILDHAPCTPQGRQARQEGLEYRGAAQEITPPCLHATQSTQQQVRLTKSHGAHLDGRQANLGGVIWRLKSMQWKELQMYDT